MRTSTYSIKQHLADLKKTKSKHPKILEDVKNYWKDQLEFIKNNQTLNS